MAIFRCGPSRTLKFQPRLPRMIFHPFLTAHAAAKISPTSAASTRSSDTLTL
jgi:hypothetical protein